MNSEQRIPGPALGREGNEISLYFQVCEEYASMLLHKYLVLPSSAHVCVKGIKAKAEERSFQERKQMHVGIP